MFKNDLKKTPAVTSLRFKRMLQCTKDSKFCVYTTFFLRANYLGNELENVHSPWFLGNRTNCSGMHAMSVWVIVNVFAILGCICDCGVCPQNLLLIIFKRSIFKQDAMSSRDDSCDRGGMWIEKHSSTTWIMTSINVAPLNSTQHK